MKQLIIDDLKKHTVPSGSIAMWWLGQSGFIFKSPRGKIIVVDAYLSNSLKDNPSGLNLNRMIPPPMEPESLVGIDLYMVTHSHQDHLDPETFTRYHQAGGKGPFLGPAESVEKYLNLGATIEQTILIWPNKKLVLDDLRITATFAIPTGPDELTPVGYLITVESGPTVYISGDTAYHDLLAECVSPFHPDVAILVINGGYNNMAPIEAARLASKIDPKPKWVIPSHYDLFPDNSQSPHMLRTNLHIMGMGDAYRLMDHGIVLNYPSSTAN